MRGAWGLLNFSEVLWMTTFQTRDIDDVNPLEVACFCCSNLVLEEWHENNFIHKR